MELEGAVGILTGASRGLGVHLADHLAACGVDLALAARSADELESTAARVTAKGVRALALPTDVTDGAQLAALVEKASTELGPVDLLVNNAGVEQIGYFHTMEPAAIERVIAVNLTAAEVLTRMVLPGMIERKRGHVVNVSSAAGKTAMPYNTVYSSTKHALVGFSWSLREEVKPHGIGVSVVCPTFVSTGMFQAWGAGKRPPGLAGVVGGDRVADATIAAIREDRAEVIVAPPLARMVDVFHAISPELTTEAARRSGLYAFLEAEARRQSGRSEGS